MTSATTRWRGPRDRVATGAVQCANAAIPIAFVELLWAANTGPWLGGTYAQWSSWFGTAAVYFALIGAAAIPSAFAARWLFPKVAWHMRTVVTCSASAAILALFLVAAAGTLSWPEGAAAVLLPLAVGVYTLSVRGGRAFGGTTASLLVLVSLLSGILTVRAAASLRYTVGQTAGYVLPAAAISGLAVLVLASLTAILLSRSAAARRVRWVTIAAIAFAFPAALYMSPHVVRRANAPHDAPNVLLITADALRAGYCSTFGGHVPTPNLGRLAQRGARFDACYSTAPWTIPALNAMFSAKYAPGLSPNVDVKERETEQLAYQTLAGYWLGPDGAGTITPFARRGYATAAYCGNGTMCDQGWLFDQFAHVVIAGQSRAWATSPLPLNPLADRCVKALFPGVLEDVPLDTTAEAAQFATDFLRTHFSGPFFLWVHFLDPHTPNDPPARYRKGAAPARGRFLGENWAEGAGRPFTNEEARALYEGEIEYMDSAVGTILDTLGRLGLDGRTYVCFSADHGEELWDRGQHGHGHSLLNEVVQVPLLFAGPSIAPRTIAEPVSTIGVMPTLLELAGLSGKETRAGRSLAPALRGEACDAVGAPCYALATHEFVPRTEPQQMVRDGRYKYVRGLVTGSSLLFDEADDALERTNLVESKPDVAARLDAELDAWQQTFPADFTAAQQAYGTIPAGPPSDEFRKNLEALGYL